MPDDDKPSWKPDTGAGLNAMSLANKFRQAYRAEAQKAKLAKKAPKQKATPQQLAEKLKDA